LANGIVALASSQYVKVSPAPLPAVTGDAVRSIDTGAQTNNGLVIIKTGVASAIVIDWL